MIGAALLPFAALGAVLGLDVVGFPQAMVSRPIVAATIAGAMAGATGRGLLVGVVLELFALEMLPVGASRYPEWGSASVVAGAIVASASVSVEGALVGGVVAALATSWLGGRSMILLRELNGRLARRAQQTHGVHVQCDRRSVAERSDGQDCQQGARAR